MGVSLKYYCKAEGKWFFIKQQPMLSLTHQFSEWENRKTSSLYCSTYEKIGEQEVFRGDLIKIDDTVYEVGFGGGMFLLSDFEDGNGDYIPALGTVLQNYPDAELVGHIHTHPELIKE